MAIAAAAVRGVVIVCGVVGAAAAAASAADVNAFWIVPVIFKGTFSEMIVHASN